MWRLTIEYGLRIGEILALRVHDCPANPGDALKIVRIEDRDHGDPRGTHSPRPKTRGRSLGSIFPNSRFPQLFWEYSSKYRFIWANSLDGSRRKSLNIRHPFLLIARSGLPLSRAAANKASKRISATTGIKFHWHLGRHAFFNRAYTAVSQLDDEADRITRLDDLVYWGGWKDPNSLTIYTRRARRRRAEDAAAEWQKEVTAWDV